ncbi:MFS transporter [Aliidiomarina quisquiliarum]|uniref:MFS transporter n=1 Tax=Aliidiomarina quisquiliarum TaxID=2938947 RepID=UPI00208F31CC|nr:MFS transporter [Aliidiomarina quisquiliarum]MCO4321359.1 MFS transporter [Aliidiomarina quisquiliarum]
MQSASTYSGFVSRLFSSRRLLVLGIIFIAANLRAPISALAPVLDAIIEQFSLTPTQAGMLTTLPLLAFAMGSPLATSLAQRVGVERSLFIALLLIGLGLCSRLVDSSNGLFIGTAVIGIGIAIGNVLLPSVIKRDFPTQLAVMTSTYVLVMGIVSGGYSALILPLSLYKNMGWQLALAGFAVITLFSILLWLPQLRRHTPPPTELAQASGNSKVWRSPLAWQITTLLGFNSFFTYIMYAWMPSILIERGVLAEQAGVLHGVFQVAAAVAAIALIPILARLKDQRLLSFSLASLTAVGSLGLLFAPQLAMFWSVALGFFSGCVFILGLSFISLRTDTTSQTTSLSGMAQCLGYLLAASGPMIAGYLQSFFNSWTPVLWLCVAASLICAVAGLFCGRNITINEHAAR